MENNRQRLQEIFSNAVEIADPTERETYLVRACEGDLKLRQEIDSLLGAHVKAAEFLQHPAPGATQRTASIPALSETSGTRIGRYKLLEQIGEGGFGVVWMAEQEEPVRRRVALKIIKLGMDTKEVVARFEAERQALALMDHPNIASVFDGGATDAGRPYFVMELVKGLPITEYCDAQKLSTEERLKLIIQVCEAVQHAHQKGIIHRDLKPSNILVTVKADKPVPKVIDFGVAKATQARLTEKTYFTQFRQWIGTPAYMSPEQAGLASLDVDTRSDVYALGVLLYELLTGHTPFETQQLLRQGYDAVMRTIREEDPPKPSERLSTLKEDDLSSVAAKRHVEPANLNRLVRGDLDWIVMKCLEKDRQRRYESAGAFELDLERYLKQQPVSAAAPSITYRTGKFVRRNGLRLAFGALICIALMLAAVGAKYGIYSWLTDQLLRETETTTVFSAATSEDVGLLGRLLRGNAELVNLRDADGSTPLAYAARSGMTNALQLLISKGALVNATNMQGLTPLFEAVQNSHAPAVSILLRAHADPNCQNPNGLTALADAAARNSVEIGHLLLNGGADIEATFPQSKSTALHMTSILGHADFVELLLSHGAHTEARDATGSTPLHHTALGITVETFHKQMTNETHRPRTGAYADTFASNRVSLMTSNFSRIARLGGDFRRTAELLIAHGGNVEATNNRGNTPLHCAMFMTNAPVARILIEAKADLNARGDHLSTPLNMAAFSGSETIVRLLLEAGAEPNLVDEAGFTALHTAVEHRHSEVARILVAYHADPNPACPDGMSPLHTAAALGDIESMRSLLEAGAIVNAMSPQGTPLVWASRRRELEAIDLLLGSGAKPDVGSVGSGMNALHWAAALGHHEIVNRLLNAGADVNNMSTWAGTPLHSAALGRHGALRWVKKWAGIPGEKVFAPPVVSSHSDYSKTLRSLLDAKAKLEIHEPNYGRTPLAVAVREGSLSAVDALLKAGANLEAVSSLNHTPLHEAAEMHASPSVSSNIVNRLIKAGANLEARDYLRGTPLHRAVNADNLFVTRLLVDAGARVNSVGPGLRTPLHLAASRNSLAVVKLLLEVNADPNWKDEQGTTALHQAIELKSVELVGLLLEHGADPNSIAAKVSTPMILAAGNGDVRILNLLLERGAKINEANRAGWTPFQAAAASGNIDAVQLLLDRDKELDLARDGGLALIAAAKAGKMEMAKYLLAGGASVATRNRSGFTALHEAADRGHAQMVELLLDHGADIEARDVYESTPIHVAANGVFNDESNYVEVVHVLIGGGADVNTRRNNGQTALHRAALWGHPKIVKTLLDAGADPSLRDDDSKSAFDLTKVAEGVKLRPGVAAGLKECAKLLRPIP